MLNFQLSNPHQLESVSLSRSIQKEVKRTQPINKNYIFFNHFNDIIFITLICNLFIGDEPASPDQMNSIIINQHHHQHQRNSSIPKTPTTAASSQIPPQSFKNIKSIDSIESMSAIVTPPLSTSIVENNSAVSKQQQIHTPVKKN